MKPLKLARPHAIIMLGIPGSGKTTFAERFADTFAAPVINEFTLVRRHKLSYKAARAVTNDFLTEILKTNQTFVLEGPYYTVPSRTKLVDQLAKAGYAHLFVWVQTEPGESQRRALKSFPAGSGLTSKEFATAVTAFRPPSAKEKAVVVSGHHTFASQLKSVLRQLTLDRAAAPPQPRHDHHTDRG